MPWPWDQGHQLRSRLAGNETGLYRLPWFLSLIFKAMTASEAEYGTIRARLMLEIGVTFSGLLSPSFSGGQARWSQRSLRGNDSQLLRAFEGLL